ncbi:MAG: LamG domain-containing protein, partial [Planctomycetota bacterium]
MCRKSIYLVFLIFVLALVSNARAGLEGHWKLDEGSGSSASDGSGKGRNGTISGATWISPGWDGTGSCLDFDGQATTRVSLGAFDVPGNAISIACWYKADTLDTLGSDPRMVSKANGGAADAHWWMMSSGRQGGQFRLRFRLKTTDGAATTTLMAGSTGVINTDVWTLAVMTWDGSTMRIYKNATEVGSVGKGGDALATNPNVGVGIGNQPSGAEDRPFDGLIDDVQIYNRAMSATQVQDLLNGIYPTWLTAYEPTPEDETLLTEFMMGILGTSLTWKPGDFADTHDV